MGAWIETQEEMAKSLSLAVAPRMGAWIETEICPAPRSELGCRAPHGRVD